MTSAQLPLIAIAADVTAVRPKRSASFPATTLAGAPLPITRKAATAAQAGAIPCCWKLANKNNGIQVHMAYSSHIWPR